MRISNNGSCNITHGFTVSLSKIIDRVAGDGVVVYYGDNPPAQYRRSGRRYFFQYRAVEEMW